LRLPGSNRRDRRGLNGDQYQDSAALLSSLTRGRNPEEAEVFSDHA